MKKIMALMTVVFIVVLSVSPAFAYEFNGFSHPTLGEMGSIEESYNGVLLDCYTNEGMTYAVLVEMQDGNPTLIMSTAPFKQNDVNQWLYSTSGLSYRRFMWAEVDKTPPAVWQNITWGKKTLGDNQQLWSEPVTVRWSSYDLKDNGGNLVMEGDTGFFPQPPLAEVIQGVTSETLTSQTVPAVTGTMRIVVLCGVGCLALLTVLVLLPKKFWMFLR